MDDLFWRILVATVAGNLLTVWFLYSVYRLTKAEQSDDAPRAVWYGGMLAPLFIVICGILIFKTAN